MNISRIRLIVWSLLAVGAVLGVILAYSGESPVFTGQNEVPKTITGYLEDMLQGE